jgi:hypothetical protein
MGTGMVPSLPRATPTAWAKVWVALFKVHLDSDTRKAMFVLRGGNTSSVQRHPLANFRSNSSLRLAPVHAVTSPFMYVSLCSCPRLCMCPSVHVPIICVSQCSRPDYVCVPVFTSPIMYVPHCSRPRLCMCPCVLAPCVLAPPPSTTPLRQAPPHPAASSPLPPPWALVPRWPRPRAMAPQCRSPQALQAALWPPRLPGHPLGKGRARPRRLPPNLQQRALQFGSRTCPAPLSAK